jgi:hypothetical protein
MNMCNIHKLVDKSHCINSDERANATELHIVQYQSIWCDNTKNAMNKLRNVIQNQHIIYRLIKVAEKRRTPKDYLYTNSSIWQK